MKGSGKVVQGKRGIRKKRKAMETSSESIT